MITSNKALETLKERARAAREKAIAEGRPMPTMAEHPMIKRLRERAKIQPMKAVSASENMKALMERINQLKRR